MTRAKAIVRSTVLDLRGKYPMKTEEFIRKSIILRALMQDSETKIKIR